LVPLGAQAQTAPHPSAEPGPAPYETFVKGATVLPGLIPVIEKAGGVYLELTPAQLGQDFIETSVPTTGLGGFGPAPGEPYVAPARIIHFDRIGDRVVLRWPNTIAQVNPATPQAAGVKASLPSSVVGVEPIVATDAATGAVVIPASVFLGDVSDFAAVFDSLSPNPQHGYHLDPTRTFFTKSKAFPDNDVLRVSQTWASADPDTIDNAPDARSIEVGITYNIIAAPHDGYMPRIADPRVGYFEQPRLDFQNDPTTTRAIDYIARWNFAPEHPGTPSTATRPLVYFLSDTIPEQYRATVKAALLTWNNAFAKAGILNAVQVKDQPTDPSWDADDIRHNMIRWIDTSSPAFGAEALLITDPRTGEELNTGVNVDAVEGTAKRYFRYIVAPERGLADTQSNEQAFEQAYLRSVVLHESGHDLGLQHNFIGSMAYTAKNLQNRAFTSKYGVASSVMEYAPVNLWPKNTAQGDYVQLVLGPYDYYAIQYGYTNINASTPQAELPTLNRLASRWNDPRYRFASDEDAGFGQGHAIDPRVAMFDLTNHPLDWCSTQTTMLHGLMNSIDRHFPQAGQPYDDARRAFSMQVRPYITCATMAAHTIGGEYLSRANRGERGSRPPLQAVPRSQESRAWHMLSTELFSDQAWHFNPNVLNRLTYSEVSSLSAGGSWAYNPTARHDISVSALAASAQEMALSEIFAPLTLQRIDDLSTKYRAGSTMSLTDLFDWSRDSIFGGIANGSAKNDGVVRRNLQTRFAQRLAAMWVKPVRGTPADAQAMARLQLAELESSATRGAQARGLDEQTRAHLGALASIAKQALDARSTAL
ncbi:MAG: zinc-dependent metalloprotease, partial [Candidatus Eremiobacteraeota bacterium]|nr:zinc-dependent metalloprotease [Candidatus Eremiobacteraeota bacterium]